MSDDQLMEVFNAIDTGRNGEIDATELWRFLKKNNRRVSLKQARQFINDGDEDGDQRIDFDEFKRIYKSGSLKRFMGP